MQSNNMKRADSSATLRSMRSTRSDATSAHTRLSQKSFLHRASHDIQKRFISRPRELYDALTEKGSKLLEKFYDPLTDLLLERVKWVQWMNQVLVKLTKPNSKLHRMWSLWIAVVSLYMVILTPFRISFFEDEHWFWIPIDLILDCFLWMDVILFSLTPFQPKSSTVKVTKYRKTVWHYATSRNGAMMDVLPLIPLDWLAFFTRITPAVFRAHRILRAFRINYYFKKLETVFKKVNPSLFRVAHLLCLVVLLAHWITCLWYLIVRLEGDSSIYWTSSNILLEGDTGNDFKYMLGLYWSLVSMAGYGGTMPVTDLETVFSIGVVMLGVAVYVTIIGTVGSLVTNLDSNASKFREKMDTINDYMKYRSLEDNIRTQVRNYYNYIWNSRKGLDETKILEDLPDFLKMSVALHLNKDIIKKVPLLKNADDNFVSEIVVRLKPRVSLPNSYIIRMGETGREMFFLSKGKVDVVIGNGIVVAQFTGGSFFGEIALIYDVKRTATIRATEFCDLFVLTKEDFDEICEAYPEEARKIKQEAEERRQQTSTKKEAEDDDNKKSDSASSGSDKSEENQGEESGEEKEEESKSSKDEEGEKESSPQTTEQKEAGNESDDAEEESEASEEENTDDEA